MRWRRLLVAVAVVALLGAFNAQRGREAERLARCTAETTAQVDHAVARALGVEQYAEPAIDAPGTPARVRASLEQQVTEAVVQELPDVRRARATCDYWRLPWGGPGHDVAALDRRIALLRKASLDRDALHDPALFSP